MSTVVEAFSRVGSVALLHVSSASLGSNQVALNVCSSGAFHSSPCFCRRQSLVVWTRTDFELSELQARPNEDRNDSHCCPLCPHIHLAKDTDGQGSGWPWPRSTMRPRSVKLTTKQRFMKLARKMQRNSLRRWRRRPAHT